MIVQCPREGWRALDVPPDVEAGLGVVLALSRAAPPSPHVLIVDLTSAPWRVIRVGPADADGTWKADLEWAARMAAHAGPAVRAVFIVRQEGDAAELVLAHPIAGRTEDGRPS